MSFSVRAGEVHALIGENGAGKSTLIKVMTGVYAPDAGDLVLAGQPVVFRSPLEAQDRGVSTIYQEVNLVPLMSVARNLFLNREPRRFGLIDATRMRREATKILADFGVHVDVTQPLRTLGVGAQQMVALGPGRPDRCPGGDHGRADLLAGAAGGPDPVRRHRPAETGRDRYRPTSATASMSCTRSATGSP